MQTAPTTELDAVNLMLNSIGEAPVNSLDVGLADVATARLTLWRTSREVQSRGWHFNTEEGITLSPTVEGHIPLPENTMRVDTNEQEYQDVDVVQRGNRLYDRKNHTYIFAKALKLDFIFFLNFEELPEAARWYITVKAARRFQNDVMGSETIYKFKKEDELEALSILKEAEGDTGDYNMFTGSYSVLNVWHRGGYYG